jgi:hypothetical protein
MSLDIQRNTRKKYEVMRGEEEVCEPLGLKLQVQRTVGPYISGGMVRGMVPVCSLLTRAVS